MTEEGYVGLDVHRAARIAAAGHGGQVLVSSSTAALGETPRAVATSVSIASRTSRRAERVFQLEDGEFPPFKSLHRSNLPVPPTPFLGRERELGEVAELLS